MHLHHARFAHAAVSLLLLAGTAAAQDWVQLSPGSFPSPRYAHAMAFDLARQEVVLFGGAKDGTVNGGLQDTWTWNGTNWTQKAPATVPPTRAWTVMSYDLGRGVVVMFGGRIHGGPVGPSGALNDLWEWDGTNWKQIMAPNPPAPRYGASMAYDSARGVHVLYSGVNASNVSFDETWEYNGTTQTWTQVSPTMTPAGRVYAGMAYDQSRRRCVLYGGADDTFTIRPDVFWEFDGTNWTPVVPATTPGPAQGHVLVYDQTRARIVIQGGQTTGRGFRVGTWEYDGVHTYAFNAESNPAPGSWLAAGAYDWIRSRMVVFGGYAVGYAPSSATWERDQNLPGFAVFGAGCGSPAPLVSAGNLPGLGTTFHLNIANLPAGPVSVLFGVSNKMWSSVPLPLNLALIGLPACNLYTSIEVVTSLPSSGGNATWSLPIPNNPSLAGFTFYDQAVASSGGGLVLSNASAATVY